jgi:hypothetical protein
MSRLNVRCGENKETKMKLHNVSLLLLLVAILLYSNIVSGHKVHNCIHNEITKNSEDFKDTALQFKNGVKRSLSAVESTWKPLRATFYFENLETDTGRACYKVGDTVTVGNPSSNIACTAAKPNDCYDTCTEEWLVTNEKIAQMKNVVIPGLRNDLQSLLTVRRLTDDLTVATDQCKLDGITYPIPTSLTGPGLEASKSDIAIVVYMRPRRGNLGYASFCKTEPVLGRPVIGVLNVSPTAVMSESDYYEVIRHEMTHVLAFSPFLYSTYKDENGNVRSNPTKTVSKTTKTITQITTPKVLQVARDHFGCQSLTGVDLEEYGGAATASAHWEMSQYMNEMMVGSNEYVYQTKYPATFSNLTLALLEDSGWYKIANYKLAMPLIYGRNTGCTMLNSRCENWSLGNRAGYFCSTTDKSVEYCNYEHSMIGSCGIQTLQTPLDTYYRHFPSNQYQYGYGILADYCPLVRGISDCRNSATTRTKNYGEVFGSKSACFHGNAGPSVTGTAQAARCYTYSCGKNDVLTITVGTETITCPSDQSYKRNTLTGTLGGYVDCPQDGFDLMCGPNKVPSGLHNTDSAAASIPSNILIVALFAIVTTFVALL